MHQQTRSKKVINTLSALKLSIRYDKVLQIETSMASTIADNMDKNKGVFLLPNICKGIPIHFAIDNTDFANDTPDGKREFHGTGKIEFQKNNEGQVNIKIERSNKKTFKSNLFKVHSHCFKPTPPNETFNNFSMIIECNDLAFHQGTDQTWAVYSSIPKSDSNIKAPTWSSYNSLMLGKPEQTICQRLPLLPGTPTDWSNLYTTLKLVQGINVSVSGHAKTIVSLDLQLYAKCMQLRKKKEIAENFVFRLGELHIAFAMLKVIGKYVDCSGIDRPYIESRIYGHTTLGQIIDGKHMKRCIEAYVTMYLALFSKFLQDALNDSGIDLNAITTELESLLKISIEAPYDNFTEHLKQHGEMMEFIKRSGILDKLEAFKKNLNNQELFLHNFMTMIEGLLLFVRASR